MKMKKWSQKYGDCCIECGTTEIPHKGHGLCKKYWEKNYHKKYDIEHKDALQKYRHNYYKRNRNKILIRNKLREAKNKAALKIYNKIYKKKYYQNNKTKCEKYRRKYYQEHKRKIIENTLQYYNDNKNQMDIKRKKYRQSLNGKSICKITKRKYRARKKGVDFWTKEMTIRWWWMLDATEGYCPMCGNPFDNGEHKFTMDHILPLNLVDKLGKTEAIKLGAIHHIDNVQVLCMKCNSKKHTKIPISKKQ